MSWWFNQRLDYICSHTHLLELLLVGVELDELESLDDDDDAVLDELLLPLLLPPLLLLLSSCLFLIIDAVQNVTYLTSLCFITLRFLIRVISSSECVSTSYYHNLVAVTGVCARITAARSHAPCKLRPLAIQEDPSD